MEQGLSGLKQKIVTVQKLWWKYSFGAEAHQWALRPCLTEEQIVAFEVAHSTRLPEEYRSFLCEVGDGGLGPSYGILPLASWQAGIDVDEIPGDFLARTCPLQDGLVGDHWLEQIGGSDGWEKMDCGAWHPFQGTITLCHHGCHFYTLLIVNGPLRGRICHVDTDYSLPDFTAFSSFLSWYENWLDHFLEQKWWQRLLTFG